MESSLLCLTPAEVRELSGYKAHRAQRCWLEANHLRYVLDRCGRPKVLRSVIDARLGAADGSPQSPHPALSNVGEPAVRPNFSVLSTACARGYRSAGIAMGRKRSVGGSLPPNMYKQRHSYYFRSSLPPSTWVALGKELGAALRNYQCVADAAATAPVPVFVAPANVATTTPPVRLFSDLVDWYFREIVPSKRPRTQADNRTESKLLLSVLGDVALTDIRAIDVRQYMHERGKSAKTRANRELALMRHMFNRAIALEVFPGSNPCEHVDKFAEKGRSRYVTDDELRAVWNAACQPLRDTLDLSYLLGQRPEDTRQFQVTDIQGDSLRFVQSKTQKKVAVKIAGALKEALAEILPRARRHGVTQLIVDENGTALTKDSLRGRFDRARLRAGVDFQMRDLRAKSASDTVDIGDAQRRLAHSSVAMTERYRRAHIGVSAEALDRKITGQK